jgi:murein DD-endopeptidase MepM/ murein hydrolase activator NlpD
MKRADVNNEACPACGTIPYDRERRVLVRGRVRRSFCSQACLHVGVRALQRAGRAARLRAGAALLAVALVAVGVGYVQKLVGRVRARHAPIAAAPSPPAPTAPPEPAPFGPQWPPSDDEWLAEFTRATWIYPLPGPTRRRPTSSTSIFVADVAAHAHARCRTSGRCGVDLGGELWGEQVYAAHDGVVDRVQRGNEDAPGGLSVRIAHWGGAVFTSYFHLAALPAHLAAGMRVSAGDVIGLTGDTGTADARAHLHFALSVRPSSELPEVFWDPEPLMTRWPLHVPERGGVAGLLTADAPAEHIAGTPIARRR